MAEGLLRFENVAAAYGPVTALEDVSLSLGAAETVTLLGANGAGKSTVARVASGLVPVAAGKVYFDGTDVTKWPAHRIRRAGLIYVPEGRGVLPGLSVLDNLRLAVNVAPRGQRRAAIDRAFEYFPALAGRRAQQAGSMSGGEQQMLALARALILPARLVIADELSLGLAPRVVEAVFDAIGQAREARVAVLLIEQFVHRALAMSDRCVILRRGTDVWSGPADAAAERAAEEYLGADRGTATPA
jgi:branched-chain amino acid transport system ATP-binding protein